MKNDGSIWTWGNNNQGQIGDNTNRNRTTPVQVIGPSDILYGTSIVKGAFSLHIMTVKSDGSVWGWGYNSNYQLGDYTKTNRYLPVQTFVTFVHPAVEEPAPPEPADNAKLSVLLAVGETARLSLTDDSTGSGHAWSSSDDGVAVVDQSGKVNAVGEGECRVYCKSADGKYTEYIPVKVIAGDSVNKPDKNINLADSGHSSGVYASSTWCNDSGYEADKAVDGSMDTRWASADEADNPVEFTVLFDDTYTFNYILLRACTDRVEQYELQYLDIDGQWVTFRTGGNLPDNHDALLRFDRLTGDGVRLIMYRDELAVSLYEFQVRYIP